MMLIEILAGYFTSSMALLADGWHMARTLALLMSFISIERLLSPVSIRFNQAIVVAVAGLVVNFVCAAILFDKHQHHHDHNAKSAHACELVVVSAQHRGAEYYQKLIMEKFHIDHLIVEEHLTSLTFLI